MLWTPSDIYYEEPFEYEVDLEEAIHAVSADLFGSDRIYIEVKKKIGAKGKTNNVPDAYLIDHEPSHRTVSVKSAEVSG